MIKNFHIFYYPSPLGLLKIKFNKDGIISINYVNGENITNGNFNGTDFIKPEIRSLYNLIYDQLNEYFTGQRKKFNLPLLLRGTDFQIQVWQNLIDIPYGQTKSYSEIATLIGNSEAARAVGNANNKNPLAIIIPCHRVVGSNNQLTGYAGGLWRKKWLLRHERKYFLTSCKRKEDKFG